MKIPDGLKSKYPDAMTIILQHQFKQLNVRDDGFQVVLWFKGYPGRLTVPLGAIKSFWDRDELKCSDG